MWGLRLRVGRWAGVGQGVTAGVRPGGGFGLRYRGNGGGGPGGGGGVLSACWNARFEDVPPVRDFPSYRGQRSFPGLYFAACMGRHVGFESWVERDNMMLLDFSR